MEAKSMSGRSELDRGHRLSIRDLRIAISMQETLGVSEKAEQTLTVALPPPPAVDAVEQRAEDDGHQHSHHYPHRVRARAVP
uniref:Uncharacterized protein n=1 Tax=Arundo donax TaxID=35708 RepID=A0A0A9EJZ5_ARUDO